MPYESEGSLVCCVIFAVLSLSQLVFRVGHGA